jgi:L-ascorbate metabolism protein UlaG (beta-lactamase superfamily)
MRVVCDDNTSLNELLADEFPALGLAWLGQAGFVVRWGDCRLLVDPYLSDSLAKKYRGTPFPHRRMMPPPVEPGALAPLDAVLCTHAHTDHMDPETLGPLAAANPACRFVVPRAALAPALARGVPAERAVAVNAGEEVQLASDVRICALPAAHEELKTDADGQHFCLGYVLHCGPAVVYHAGDCVPYAGLAETLAAHKVQLALLPVNGRDAERRAHGIPGNFTFAEAVELCTAAGIRAMIACHFGMFDFNTVDVDWLDRQLAVLPAELQCVRPHPGQVLFVSPRIPS